MDQKRFENKTKKVAGTAKLKILKIEYLNRDYDAKIFPDNPATKTGLVKVMELIPKISEMPKFIFRWDEKADTLDADIYKSDKICTSLWNIEGYNGHHPQKIKNRIFKIDISIPNAKIFIGIIDIGLLMQQSFSGNANIKSSLSMRIIRKKTNR